ncbi:hypothetical protein IOD14_41555 [Streptomyces sp. A2-16]|uniref:hypothetical protein n=1 Tax=Streptomyces sp. A2-16 TaxID=2781734 RepID=UPI001BB01FED|nr:hypothetical protein [Streptomyces sp. A2-16]QUC62736.1 hypothetical protein IOD14_41555 [Streptomyces sp. A2-16]
MSDDSASGQTGPQSPHTSHGPGRTGLWIAVIGLLAAVAGPLVPVLVARSEDAGEPPARSTAVAVSTRTPTERPTDTSEPPDELTGTPDAPTTDEDARTQALIGLIATGESTLTGCEESINLDDQPLAAVSCDTTGQNSPGPVQVYSFASKSDLDSWMTDELTLYGEPDGTTCEAGGTWRGRWSHDEVAIGDLACGPIDDQYWMTWSFDEELIVVDVGHPDADLLYAWWDSAPLTF